MKAKFKYIIKGKKIDNKIFKVIGTTNNYKNAIHKSSLFVETNKYSRIEIHRTEKIKVLT